MTDMLTITNDQFESPKASKSDVDSLTPYPGWWASEFQASDGTHFTVRPIRPDDEPLLADFHRHLSEETVYRRYFSPLRLDMRVEHERLLKRCLIDYHDEMALVATYIDPSGHERLAAVGRLIKIPNSNSAEVAFVVADQHQHHGLGTYLLGRIIGIARDEGLDTLEAVMLADNFSMKNLFRHWEFRFSQVQGSEITARLTLDK
ncbi:MAG TPA: GNAT family N-acetyltransferase [Candidatus Angelobacter sp.]|nr:GNAT family N-acetyltransferase [Candidatus Angelobacter sp.]